MTKGYDTKSEINHTQNWTYTVDHPYRVLIIGGSGSGKINVLLNLTKHPRLDIEKNYCHVKDPFELKCQLLINRREKVVIKQTKIKLNPKTFIDYSQEIDNVYEN